MGAYVDVDGLSMYYEVVGEGEPVVLIHGTGGTAESWSPQAGLLADWYRVFMPECRGHGRTADVDGPYTHELFADDIAGLGRCGWPAGVTGRASRCGWRFGGRSW